MAQGEAERADALVSGHFPGPISSLKEVQLDLVSCAWHGCCWALLRQPVWVSFCSWKLWLLFYLSPISLKWLVVKWKQLKWEGREYLSFGGIEAGVEKLNLTLEPALERTSWAVAATERRDSLHAWNTLGGKRECVTLELCCKNVPVESLMYLWSGFHRGDFFF